MNTFSLSYIYIFSFGKTQSPLPFPSLPSSPIWLKRYIDDIVAIFNNHSFNQTQLHDILNSSHPSVKFTTSSPSSSVPFLDTLILIYNSQIHTDLYSKPTDSHLYLSPSSNHPKHIFHSIVYSGALRLRRICSLDTFFTKRLSEFSTYLLTSGYKHSFISPILQQVAAKARKPLLTPKIQNNTNNRITYISTYHPNMPNIKQTHAKHKQILQYSNRMSSILPKPPLIATKRTANLGNLLVKTKPPPCPQTSPSPPGTHPCGSRRCLLDQQLIISPNITSTVTKTSFPIKHHITCNTANIIYVITCRTCGAQYTGQTSNTLRTRINNHKSSIRKHDTTQPVSKHFNLPNHHGIEDMLIQGVDVVKNKEQLNQRESHWMWTLKTHHTTGGLNLEEPHFHSMTFSN